MKSLIFIPKKKNQRKKTGVCGKTVFWDLTILFFYKFISDFIPFSPNFVANHTPISSITPNSNIHRTHLVPGGLSEISRSRGGTRLLQAASPARSAVTPGVRGAFCSGDLKLSWVLPPSLGVTGQLCHSNASRPNSARGGIRNPVPRCLALANQRLRPLRPPRLHTVQTRF